MPRKKKKQEFKDPKMFSARCEAEDFQKFEQIIRYRDGLKLQEFVNLLISEYVSGSIYLSGSKFCVEVKE